ncbi:MAG: hypothetical protein A2Y66_06780 [Nitrospirae bacterium RBG_13_41_22]|nr:MAG: hypothetical protein A2Y66_06780 [Nitrospirae bacterium RBG_13_41_22]
MAKPINEILILRGKEAEYFFARVRKNESGKVSEGIQKGRERVIFGLSLFQRVCNARSSRSAPGTLPIFLLLPFVHRNTSL